MLYKSTANIRDTDIRELFEHILQEGQGKIIELSSAPTKSQPLLEAGQVGKYGNDIYWRIGDTILKFTSSEQINIT